MRPQLLLLAVLTVLPLRAGSLDVSHLRCEYREQPLGLGETKPRLMWQLAAREAAARGLRQTAWRVIVASSPEAVAAGRGDRWDSGRIAGDATLVDYAGASLPSRAACWWAVKIWDETGAESPWSAPAHWTMGLLGADEFSAQWIGLDAPMPSDGTAVSDGQRARFNDQRWVRADLTASKDAPLAMHARKNFTLPAGRTPVRAALTLVPDMRCIISLNGAVLAEVTRWDRAVPLTLPLVENENVVGLAVAQDDGYAPALLGEIEITFTSGEPLRLPVDPTWLHTVATPAAGWDRAGFDAAGWKPLVAMVHERAPTAGVSPWGTPQNATHWLAPAPLLRKTFAVAKPVRRATVYATALGIYELHLNGARIGRDSLTPGWTEYTRRVHYQTYDVTAQLQPGANALGAQLGDGWFAGLAGYTGKRHSYGGQPRLRAQLEIDYADGTRETVATDASWRGSTDGPVRYADLYLGTATDARRGQPDWARAQFDDAKWSPVATGLAEGSPKNFLVEAATLDPVRAQDELPAKKITQPRPGVFLFDLGQNMVGWVRLHVRGPAGQKLTVRHGEMLNPNGTLYTSNLRGATATDFFWLRGGGADETLEPFGTLHGFRYVEIEGLAGEPKVEAVTGIVAHNPLARTGEFACSSPLVNQLFANIIWGQKGNYVETATDCPQRDERLGWTGDTQFFIRTALYNFEAHNFVDRWLTTLITDSQGADGTFPDVAPAIGMVPHGVTGWGDAALVCTHALWQVYGDTRVVARHYDRLARYIAWLGGRAKNGVVDVGGYGDWLNKGGGAKKEVMDTAYFAHLCGLMAEMGAAIGRDAEAAQFAALQTQVVKAWRKEFLKADGSILESSQTGYALAFTMGLLPVELRAAAAEKFTAEIAAKDWHLATGFIGTPRLLPALAAAGRNDIACRVLLQETYPSWLFQVKLGATTMWERWDGWTPEQGFQSIGMNSFNHYAFGAVAEYFYRNLAGIETDGPGFRKILLAPQPAPGLDHVAASYDSPAGKIVSEWHREGGEVIYDVSIPPGATGATVRVPTADAASVREGGGAAREAKGVEFVRAEPGAAVFRVESGRYVFRAALPAR